MEKKDDMGLCLMDLVMMSDDFPLVVDTLAKADVMNEDNQLALSGFAENLFQNLSL